MQLSFYLHDLHYEIGHSNVTLNSIEYMDGVEDFDIKFIVFTHAPIDSLFKKDINFTIHKVPFGNLRPTLLKIIWFQLYTLFYSLIVDRKRTKVSLGVANLFCDISIIHFIHSQWHKMYFETLRPTGIKKIYKKIMFTYLDICELTLFKWKKTKVITVSNFLKLYIKKKFYYSEQNISTIHSGFDLSRFCDSFKSHHQILKMLITENSNAGLIDISKPLCLFVGAFERKGLKNLLKLWREHQYDAQFIIIGESEGQSNIGLSDVIHIKKTKHINEYYEISDSFLFPTIYEPFGMVLIEAAVKGLDIYTLRENVGASEVLSGIDGINIHDSIDDFILPTKFRKISLATKQRRIKERLSKLEKYNWLNCSENYKEHMIKWGKR